MRLLKTIRRWEVSAWKPKDPMHPVKWDGIVCVSESAHIIKAAVCLTLINRSKQVKRQPKDLRQQIVSLRLLQRFEFLPSSERERERKRDYERGRGAPCKSCDMKYNVRRYPSGRIWRYVLPARLCTRLEFVADSCCHKRFGMKVKDKLIKLAC